VVVIGVKDSGHSETTLPPVRTAMLVRIRMIVVMPAPPVVE
jgi:hypothetical protein